MTLSLNASLGMLCLCILLIVWGISTLAGASSRTLSIIMGILALVAGILILFAR